MHDGRNIHIYVWSLRQIRSRKSHTPKIGPCERVKLVINDISVHRGSGPVRFKKRSTQGITASLRKSDISSGYGADGCRDPARMWSLDVFVRVGA